MKKAIGYIRISTKDQSNFSLDGQEAYIRDFCAKQSYELLEVFRDEGQSAKNFDRPDWKELERFCKANHSDVDCLVVAKYDRFSRNLSDALGMIELLEEKFSIRILSVMEPIMLHPSSPYFFQFRTQMLMGAQVEWLVIRDRTRFGNHHAAKAGRYIHGAPFGYINKRDESNKPIIVIDEAKAPVIRKMFQMLLQGAPLKEIYLEAKRMGYGNRGHSAVKSTLQNPVYAGFIKVPDYNEVPSYQVKGIHQPIIDEATWYQAQDILVPKQLTRTVMNEEVPLRGVLKCFCSRTLTAGNSKGRKNYYWYYKCEDHKKFNLSANKLHAQLEEVIQELSLPYTYIDYLKEGIQEQLQQQFSDKDHLMSDKKRELQALQLKVDKLEEKYLADDIEKEAYRKWKDRYKKEILLTQRYITDYSAPIDHVWKLYADNLSKLENLLWYYQAADLHQKQTFIRCVFKSELYYQEGIYRTAYILPMFALKAASLQEKRLLIVEQPIKNIAESQRCAPSGSVLEPLKPFLELLAQIKVA